MSSAFNTSVLFLIKEIDWSGINSWEGPAKGLMGESLLPGCNC